MPNNKILASLAIALALAGCSTMPPGQQPAPPPPAAPVAASPEAAPAATPAAAEAAPAAESAPALTASVSGTLSYRTRQALPPEAVIRVQLVEAAAGGTPARVIGEQVIEAAGKQVPIDFKVAYDPAAISAKKRYQLSAQIEVSGEPVMKSTGTNRVLTAGNPKTRNLVLQPTGAKKKP